MGAPRGAAQRRRDLLLPRPRLLRGPGTPRAPRPRRAPPGRGAPAPAPVERRLRDGRGTLLAGHAPRSAAPRPPRLGRGHPRDRHESGGPGSGAARPLPGAIAAYRRCGDPRHLLHAARARLRAAAADSPDGRARGGEPGRPPAGGCRGRRRRHGPHRLPQRPHVPHPGGGAACGRRAPGDARAGRLARRRPRRGFGRVLPSARAGELAGRDLLPPLPGRRGRRAGTRRPASAASAGGRVRRGRGSGSVPRGGGGGGSGGTSRRPTAAPAAEGYLPSRPPSRRRIPPPHPRRGPRSRRPAPSPTAAASRRLCAPAWRRSGGDRHRRPGPPTPWRRFSRNGGETAAALAALRRSPLPGPGIGSEAALLALKPVPILLRSGRSERGRRHMATARRLAGDAGGKGTE